MGCLKPCYSTSTSGSVEIAELALYDEPKQREVASVEYPNNQGLDDVLGEPFFPDEDDDGLGEKTRAETLVEVKAKLDTNNHEEQQHDQAGNAPESLIMLTVYYEDLVAKGLFTDGVVGIRPNDRLLKLKNAAGDVRVDYTFGGRDGLHCVEVRPGDTGTGILTLVFIDRRAVAR